MPALRRVEGLPRPCLLMGILNVTPDSFSDGGKFQQPGAAVRRAFTMVEQGAMIIDMGAESTRPGSRPVSAKEQLRRLLPVLRAFGKKSPLPVSIDTQSAAVAEACLDEGASIINDISALRKDRRMAKVLRDRHCPVILMHMLGTPRTMQKSPVYRNVVREIMAFFRERIRFCEDAGIARTRLMLDPGIGFGKMLEHNLQILGKLEAFARMKLPLVVGVSRKSFLGRITDEPVAGRRVTASVAAGIWAVQHGAAILRVHDVAEHAAALKVLASIRRYSGNSNHQVTKAPRTNK